MITQTHIETLKTQPRTRVIAVASELGFHVTKSASRKSVIERLQSRLNSRLDLAAKLAANSPVVS